jgi:hypothetical protein
MVLHAVVIPNSPGSDKLSSDKPGSDK